MNYKYALKYVYYKAMILHVYISATNNIRYSFCYQKLLDQDFIVKLIFIISQTACCAVIMLKHAFSDCTEFYMRRFGIGKTFH